MSEIYVRVNPSTSSEARIGRRPPSLPVEAFSDRAPEVTSALVAVAEQFKAQLDDLADRSEARQGWVMDTVQVSFDMELEAKVGVVVVNGSATAALGVSVRWQRQPA